MASLRKQGVIKSKKIERFLFIILIICTACSDSNNSLPGYIEGEYTYVASGVAGTLFKLFVNRGQPIKKGDALYQLDPEPEQAAVNMTKAKIEDLKAQVAFSKLQYERQQELYPRNTSKANLDQAKADFESKSEQLAANDAQLIQTTWSLQQKTMYAPVTGLVFDKFYRIGEKVPENHPVLALLEPENIKVLFYIPEVLLSQVNLGQHIEFSCDGCKGKTHAVISYISPEAEFTPPVIYNKDTRHKLVYLIRADMPETIAMKFHPGQPIDVYLRHE